MPDNGSTEDLPGGEASWTSRPPDPSGPDLSPQACAAAVAALRARGCLHDHPCNVAAYEELFREYQAVHVYFGRANDEVRHRLNAIQRDAVRLLLPAGVRFRALLQFIIRIRREVCPQHGELMRYHFDVWRRPGGVSYGDLTP